MRAALFTGVDRGLSVEDVELCPPGPRDVVVGIGASGVCHSDLSIRSGMVPYPAPAVLGHEGAGTVEWIGAEVDRVAVGDRVIASFVPSCGNCFHCRLDESHLCEASSRSRETPRFRRSDGSTAIAFTGLGTFAEAMVVDQASVVPIRTELPDDQVALLGCGVTTGVGAALNTARVVPGSSVAVIGCGGVGQSVLQGARIAGAATIIAIDPVEMKRETGTRLGATHAVDPSDGDPVEAVRALTSGRGVDYAFEVIGHPTTIRQAYDMARRGGTAVVVGMSRHDAEVSFPAFTLFHQAKTLVGSHYGTAQVRRDFQRLVDLAESGQLDLGAMVSKRIAIDEVEDAFRAMEAGEVIRSVICGEPAAVSGEHPSPR